MAAQWRLSGSASAVGANAMHIVVSPADPPALSVDFPDEINVKTSTRVRRAWEAAFSYIVELRYKARNITSPILPAKIDRLATVVKRDCFC